MATMEVNRAGARERFVLRALAWSLAVHLLCFGSWKLGQNRGWWQAAAMPHWMQAVTKKLMEPIAVKIPPLQKKQPSVPLMFVDTDPALALKEPPPEAKYYSANNTPAANPEIKQLSDIPNITGHQQHVPKPTDAGKSKAQPLQPSPKPEEKTVDEAESKPKARPSVTPGDLAMAKPNTQKNPADGKAESDTGASAQPEPLHHRPRTIAEALEQRGMTGQKIHQTGGVPHMEHDSSFAAMGTSYGDYDSEFIAAVQTRWDQLLKNHLADTPGRVVVEFRLLPTGRITDLKVIENTVDDLSAVICSSAISENAPYRPWPRQMQLDLGADHRDVRFTFYYDNE